MGDSEERRLNIDFLAAGEIAICYAFLDRDGALHPEPRPESIKVAVIIKDGRLMTRLIPSSSPH